LDSFAAIIVIYNLQETRHGLNWLCLNERIQHEKCTLWSVGQTKFEGVEPPCVTVAEKVLSKYSLIYAGVLHGLARAELNGDNSVWFMGVLQADLFKTLGAFSLTLYLSHVNMGAAIRWLAEAVLGWGPAAVHADILLLWIYLASYWLHHAVISVEHTLVRPRPQSEAVMLQSDAQPLIDE
jgi:hypothetical protein